MLTMQERPVPAEAGPTLKVPEGCWVYEDDWTRWPSSIYECNPNEWPYNLEAPKGTPTFHEIIGWFLGRRPQISPPDLSALLSGIEQCAADKTLTAQVEMDPESGDYQLRLALYACPRRKGHLLAPMLEQIWSVDGLGPVRDALFPHVRLVAEDGNFPPLPDSEEGAPDDLSA